MKAADIVKRAAAQGIKLNVNYVYILRSRRGGRVITTTTPGGIWTATQRDGRGLVVQQIVGFTGCSENDKLTTGYAYDNDGNLTWQSIPTGVTTRYEYDGYGRRTKIVRG